MITLFLIGRVVFGLYWLHAAYEHLVKADSMVGYASSKGVGAAKTSIVLTGILLLIGGLSILLGLSPAVGIACLVVFLLGVSFRMHAYWKEADPMARMGERIQFYKNMALAGALLMLLAIPVPWHMSVTW